jgi:hypothetical protein
MTEDTDKTPPAAPEKTAPTIREQLTKMISENPKWKEAQPSGQRFVIGGAKPPQQRKGTAADAFKKELATNPRCKEAPKGEQGFVIGGQKP